MAWFGSSAGGAGVLDWPWGWLAQNLGGVQGPVGIAEHLASQNDEVGLATADDLVGLGGFGDHADGAGWNTGFVVDGLGVTDLVARADGDLLGGVVAAAGDVDEVDA